MLSWAALSWELVSVWLFDLLKIGDPITGDANLYPLVCRLVDCLLIWALLGGIGEYAAHRGRPEITVRTPRVVDTPVPVLIGMSLIGLAPSGLGGQVVALNGHSRNCMGHLAHIGPAHRSPRAHGSNGHGRDDRCRPTLAVQPADPAALAHRPLAALAGVLSEAGNRRFLQHQD